MRDTPTCSVPNKILYTQHIIHIFSICLLHCLKLAPSVGEELQGFLQLLQPHQKHLQMLAMETMVRVCLEISEISIWVIGEVMMSRMSRMNNGECTCCKLNKGLKRLKETQKEASGNLWTPISRSPCADPAVHHVGTCSGHAMLVLLGSRIT